jgi:GNAT superfamily N-acetyltransferase
MMAISDISHGILLAPQISVVLGPQVLPWLADVAALRISVFRDFPYLYEGDLAFEQKYLAAYAASASSIFVLAMDAGRVVGAATGIPLAQDDECFQQPFIERGLPVDEVFYCGESVLLPEYRGLGLGHRFFDERERHARRLGGMRWTAFAAVDRDVDDDRRPPDFRSNDAFWHKRGYQRQPGMTMRLAWRELGEQHESEKPMTFWLRPLELG